MGEFFIQNNLQIQNMELKKLKLANAPKLLPTQN